MPNASNIKVIYRIIDANINRAKEGLRVCEEVTRFILNSRTLTTGFKKARHGINSILKSLPQATRLLAERKSLEDIGLNIRINELKRKDWRDIFCANMQRIKESVRVLEEFAKLINKNAALKFKKLRYDIYALERNSTKIISSYSQSRK